MDRLTAAADLPNKTSPRTWWTIPVLPKQPAKCSREQSEIQRLYDLLCTCNPEIRLPDGRDRAREIVYKHLSLQVQHAFESLATCCRPTAVPVELRSSSIPGAGLGVWTRSQITLSPVSLVAVYPGVVYWPEDVPFLSTFLFANNQ
jgi:hypothetical protein